MSVNGKDKADIFDEYFDVKPIIIDGADVSECGFFHPEYGDKYCHIALAFSEDYGECLECENNPDCYFKQLQRLKAENEELIKDIERRKQWRVNSIYTIKKLSDNAKAYIRAFNNSNIEINELKQALEEIREIAKVCKDRSECFSCKYYDDCEIEDAEMPTHDISKFIIDKINEVLK